MPGSPLVTDRTWFGLARYDGSNVKIEGAIEPWDGLHDNARVIVIDKLGPICWLLLDPTDVNEAAVLERIRTIRGMDERPPLPELPAGELSIAICTRERPDSLRSCLQRMHSALENRHDVLVVDNAPLSDKTKNIVDSFVASGMRVRRVVEKAPGLSRARNRALREVTTEYLAFTDDDARPDIGWATALLRGFSSTANVAVVTGIVPPAQIETVSQALFEKKLKWSTSLTMEAYSMSRRGDYSFPFPYSAGHFGTGANFAINRAIISGLGGFDEALGAGTRTEGGEDMEMFVRVLRRGYELVYQPSAIVWHVHRRDNDALRKVLFGYGKGLSAAAFSEFLQPGKVDMLFGSLRGAINLTKERRAEVESGTPRDHLALEAAGVLWGPPSYLWERFRGPK
jgi:GT2 family glycosyltransferase